MQVWQRQHPHRYGVGRLLMSAVALLFLLGCGGTTGNGNSTPTPGSTATARPGATPTSPLATSTPPVGTTVTPTPRPTQQKTPTPQPTPSPCETPAGVQPVSAAEIDIGNSNRPRIALTFDAGGPSEPTARILDILAQHHV